MTNIPPLLPILHKQLYKKLNKLLVEENKYSISQLAKAIKDYSNTLWDVDKEWILSDYEKVIIDVLSEPYVKSAIKIQIWSILAAQSEKIKELIQSQYILTENNQQQIKSYILNPYEITDKNSFFTYLQNYKTVIDIAKEINSKMQVFTNNEKEKTAYDLDKYIQESLWIPWVRWYQEQENIPAQYMYNRINDSTQHEIASYIVHNIFPYIYNTTTERVIKNLQAKKEFAHAIQSHLNAWIRWYTENKSIYENSDNPKKEYQYWEIIDWFSEQEELSRDLATLLSQRAQAIIEEDHLQEYQNTSQLIDYLSPAYFSLNSLLEKYNIRAY